VTGTGALASKGADLLAILNRPAAIQWAYAEPLNRPARLPESRGRRLSHSREDGRRQRKDLDRLYRRGRYGYGEPESRHEAARRRRGRRMRCLPAEPGARRRGGSWRRPSAERDQRLSPNPGGPFHRRGLYRYARSLASLHDGRGVQSREGRVRREAGLCRGERRSGHGGRCPKIQPHCPGRNLAALWSAFSKGLRSGAQRRLR
jgi:hypothetical protein